MALKTCPFCGGDSWDSHADCGQKERPPHSTALGHKENLLKHDIPSRLKSQSQTDRAWKEFDAS